MDSTTLTEVTHRCWLSPLKSQATRSARCTFKRPIQKDCFKVVCFSERVTHWLILKGGFHPMSTSTITTRDGTTIFYKDWGTGRPVVFSHGWPLNADAWDDQTFFLASHGYRASAHDRRGH